MLREGCTRCCEPHFLRSSNTSPKTDLDKECTIWFTESPMALAYTIDYMTTYICKHKWHQISGSTKGAKSSYISYVAFPFLRVSLGFSSDYLGMFIWWSTLGLIVNMLHIVRRQTQQQWRASSTRNTHFSQNGHQKTYFSQNRHQKKKI